jgi:hypothetical protein
MRIGGSLETVMSLELVVRESAIVGYEGISPVVRREPLQQAENNYAKRSVAAARRLGELIVQVDLPRPHIAQVRKGRKVCQDRRRTDGRS